MGRKQILLLLSLFFLLEIRPVHALEISGNAGYLQLPASSYHYLTFGAGLGIGSFDSQFMLEAGFCPPFKIASYSQTIYYGSLGWQWTEMPESFLHPYIGVGLGVYNDAVNNMNGITPAIVMDAGVKLGSAGFGAKLGVNVYLGIYDPSQLGQFEMWPMTRFLGGVYAAF